MATQRTARSRNVAQARWGVARYGNAGSGKEKAG